MRSDKLKRVENHPVRLELKLKLSGRIMKLNFWVLVIEAENSAIDSLEGLPQLLTYAYKSLERQSSVWGLTTNGTRYDFFYIQ
ncbi:hypothetical protein TUMEXPCC7403_04085 [Tumidithrix helvetica PCC 7403]